MGHYCRQGLARIALRCMLMGGLLPSLGTISASWAAESEAREFTVSIDGRAAGKYSIEIAPQDDGSVVVKSNAKVSLNYLIYRYTYSFQGQEQWRNGRLLSLHSSSNDNGKQFQVVAEAEGDHVRVAVNGKTEKHRWDVWTTTYWRLPADRFRNQGIPLLDADTGRYLEGTLQFVNMEPITVAGELVNCAHYRISAPGIDVHAWYDAKERLVGQTSMEDGHKTVFTLSLLRRRLTH